MVHAVKRGFPTSSCRADVLPYFHPKTSLPLNTQHSAPTNSHTTGLEQSLHDASQSFRVSGIGYRWSPQSCCRIPRFLASSLAEMGNATQKNHVIRLPRPEVSADLFAFKRRPISRGDVMPHKTGRSLQLPLLRITRITPRSKLLFCYIIHTRTY